MRRPALLVLGITVAAAVAAPAADPALLRTFKVGGEGRWDYVSLDPAAGRIHVPRSTHMMVLDLDGHVKGDLPATEGIHGVALAPALDRGWTSNGKAGTVTVFKLSTLSSLVSPLLPPWPRAIAPGSGAGTSFRRGPRGG